MDMLIWAIGLGLIIVAYIVNVKRGNQPGSHYHDGMYHDTHDSNHRSDVDHGGDWGAGEMSHDHYHGGYDSDSSGVGGGERRMNS